MQEGLQAPKALLRAQTLAHLSDNKIRIPILGVRLGLDFLIGLIPVIGDLIMVGLSLYIVRLAMAMKMPKALILAMLKNILVDFLIGLVPILGDVADIFFKSNEKNVRIMEKWWVTNNHQDIQRFSKNKLAEWEQSQQ